MARQKLLAFGAYPAVFLAKARQRKDQAREQLADGVDPRADQEFEARVGTIERGRGAKGDRVRVEILKRNLPFSISDIEEACPGISRDMVRLILRAMKAEGLIAPTGKGRGARWVSLTVPLGSNTSCLTP